MEVEWNPEKARTNLKKHSVHFSDAIAVLSDPNVLTFEDQNSQGKQRFVILGLDSLWRLLVVVYTHRSDKIRLISARLATNSEKRKYESGI